MWNPTPSSASSSQSSSDNKPLTKEVEVDDCKCSGSSSVGEQQLIDQQLQQQIGRNNSKHQQTSTFGGQLTSSTTSNQQHKQQQQVEIPSAIAGAGAKIDTASQDLEDDDESDNKKFLESTEETTDSGFISGPQTSSSSNIFPDTSKTTAGTPSGGAISKQLNITDTADQQQKQQQYEIPNLDSGCIEAEDDDSETEQQQQHQQNPTKDPQMLLKNNVDAGMSEWFCNLSLQNNPVGGSTTNTSQQQRTQQSMSVTGSGLNNLDAPKTRPTQQQQHQTNRPSSLSSSASLPTSYLQHAAGSSATNVGVAQQTQSGNIPQQITPANAWEHYYQQNDDGDTPLHLACISGYVDVVAALIRMAPHPCLFNIQNDEAQTPLHLATLTAQPKIIRMLLIAGAEPTIRDRHGNTALHLACISGEEQCVRALTIPISASEVHEAHRQYGHRANDKSYLKYAHLPSDLEIRNYDGERCVHLAAQYGYIDILRILVLYGADINAREGKSGRTPLHIAIECCNEDLANFLLDECQKLNLETATYAGLTAYQVACALNKSEMQDILEKRGAEPLTPPDSDYDSSDIETDLDDSKFHRFGDPGYFLGYKGGNVMTVA